MTKRKNNEMLQAYIDMTKQETKNKSVPWLKKQLAKKWFLESHANASNKLYMKLITSIENHVKEKPLTQEDFNEMLSKVGKKDEVEGGENEEGKSDKLEEKQE